MRFSIDTFIYCFKKIAVVGRGAVGSAIRQSLQPFVDEKLVKVDCYHSENIEDIFDQHYDLVIYAGVRAFKQAADSDPSADLMHVLRAADILTNVRAQSKILISTIDAGLPDQYITAYGRDRRLLERRVMNSCSNCRILRLPALFGSTVVKNTWYDMMIGPENVNLSKELTDMIAQDNQLFGKRNLNILSMTGNDSKFVWFNLDTILEAIVRIIQHNDKGTALAVSYDNQHKDGMLLKHQTLKQLLGYGDVEQLQCYRSIDYSKALTDQDVLFVHSPVKIDDSEHWKKVIKK